MDLDYDSFDLSTQIISICKDIAMIDDNQN